MTGNTLALPLDIAWQRIGYSRDLIDTNFDDLLLPPKWRSSLAVYSYVVPEIETADSYPDSRIVYLKLSCSITGWNPSENLRNAQEILNQNAGDQSGDAQISLWEAIRAQGWASTYWPCHGAIAQIAVFPSQQDGQVQPDDYPYVMDFEPKKRELYEARTESGEYLSGTAHEVSTSKGTTSVKHTEKSVKVSAGYGPVSGSVGYKQSDETTKIDNETTDNSREKRETQSHSTSFSQMYQLFNGYHLGTNRALFLVSPRPHIVNATESGLDATQTDFNLIDGQRKLEGIQEMFLVIHVPKSLSGVCVQASLDTGHNVREELVATAMAAPINIDGTPNFPVIIDGGGGGGGGGGNTDPVINDYLVVTRRHLKCCGQFIDGSKRLRPVQIPVPFDINDHVYEDVVGNIGSVAAYSYMQSRGGNRAGAFRRDLADRLNQRQREISSKMLDGLSSGAFQPRSFFETQTFQSLATQAIRTARTPLNNLLTKSAAEALYRSRRSNLVDLFSNQAKEPELDDKSVQKARDEITNLFEAAVETAVKGRASNESPSGGREEEAGPD